MDFSERLAGTFNWKSIRPQVGDTIEIAADWDGSVVNGPEGDWLAVSSGEFVTISECADSGAFLVQRENGEEGWIGGIDCKIRVVLDVPLGPQEPIGEVDIQSTKANAARGGAPLADQPSLKKPRISKPAPKLVRVQKPHAHVNPVPPPPQPQRMVTHVSPMEVADLIEQRNQARKDKNFAWSDDIRNSLKARGVCLIDEKGARGDLQGLQVTVWHYVGEPPESASAVFSEEHINMVIEERNEARKGNDFRRADEIRNWLNANGIVLRDEKNARGDLSGTQVTAWHFRDGPSQGTPVPPAAPPAPAPPRAPPRPQVPLPPRLAQQAQAPRGLVRPQPAPTLVQTVQTPPGRPTEQEIARLIEERNEARKNKDFAKSDEVRNWLKAHGVILIDQKGASGDRYGQEVTSWHYA